MTKFDHKPLVGFAGAVALACVACFNLPFADNVSGIETEDSFAAKVAALEKTVARLRQ